MTARLDAAAEFRRHPFAALVCLASIFTLLALGMAGDLAVQQAKNPDLVASDHCGGAIGGGAQDTSTCYEDAVARSPLQAAEPWLAVAGTSTVVLCLCGAGVLRRQRRQFVV